MKNLITWLDDAIQIPDDQLLPIIRAVSVSPNFGVEEMGIGDDPGRQPSTAGISGTAAQAPAASDNRDKHPAGLAPIGIRAFHCVSWVISVLRT